MVDEAVFFTVMFLWATYNSLSQYLGCLHRSCDAAYIACDAAYIGHVMLPHVEVTL